MGFIEKEAQRQYEKCVEQVKQNAGIAEYTCNRCSFEILLPPNQINSNRRGNTPKRTCPQGGACGIFYDFVVKEHTETNPKWCNANFDLWSSSHVEFIKCFIFKPGYKEKKSFAQLDALALLQICRYNRSLYNRLFDQSFQNLVDSVSYTMLFVLYFKQHTLIPDLNLYQFYLLR